MGNPRIDQEHERLDVVDDNDQVISQASRGEIHRLGQRHRAAHVLVFNPAGELFLQRRALWKECAPGLWDTSAAGHLAANENYAVAARRELEEELGIMATLPLARLFKLKATAATGFEFVEVFMTTVSQALKPDPTEIMDSRWCTTATVGAWISADRRAFTGTFLQIWALRRAQGGWLIT